MPGTGRAKKCLFVADGDPAFRSSILDDPRQGDLAATVVDTGVQAQHLLADHGRVFVAIFVNVKIVSPGCLSVIRFAHLHRPATPIYLIENRLDEHKEVFGDWNLSKLGIRGVLTKPLTLESLIRAAAPIHLRFDPKQALDKAKNDTQDVGAEASREDGEFIGIAADTFVSGNTSLFDLFIRLSTGRYLKLLKAGDSFTPERLEKYLKRGVSRFHIRREMVEAYLDYCDHLAAALNQMAGAPKIARITMTGNHGHQTAEFLKKVGVNETTLRHAQKFVKNVHQVTERMKLTDSEIVRSFLGKAGTVEHAAGTTMIASVLWRALGITSERPVEIVGMATFFHDIALMDASPAAQAEDPSKMSEEDLKIWYAHPFEGARILTDLKEFDSAVATAVTQHHVRHGKLGFPRRISFASITPLAEVVGICSEFQHLIVRVMAGESTLDWAKELESKVFPGFSRQVLYGFRSSFIAPSKKAA